jgi:Methionyl-tRNA formyltransferase
MRVAIIGQQAFGKSVLDAFVARDDEVVGVFCAPEKEGARPDPLRLAAQQLGVRVVTLPTLRGAGAEEALAALGADLAVMAFVLQFAPKNFVNLPSMEPSSTIRRSCRSIAAHRR